MITTDLNILRKPNDRVSLEEAKKIIKLLEAELNSSNTPGVGLAAPQIGINKSVALVKYKNEIYNLVNPTIVDRDQAFINEGEGCLSLPGISLNVERHKEIFIKDEIHPDGFIVLGFAATIIEHEVDHLESILIIDRAGKNKVGRNDPCPCGKMKNNKPIKWKNCHGKY